MFGFHWCGFSEGGLGVFEGVRLGLGVEGWPRVVGWMSVFTLGWVWRRLFPIEPPGVWEVFRKRELFHVNTVGEGEVEVELLPSKVGDMCK